MTNNEYIKVELSKCFYDFNKDRIAFTCIVCGKTFHLDARDSFGIICCKCSDYLFFSHLRIYQMKECFSRYYKANNLNDKNYYLKEIYKICKRFNIIRGYLESISK